MVETYSFEFVEWRISIVLSVLISIIVISSIAYLFHYEDYWTPGN